VAGFFLMGATFTGIGAALPEIIRGFGWSYADSGIFLAAGSIAFFLCTLAAGALGQRFGARKLLVSAFLISAAGCLGLGAVESLWINIIFHVFLGVGHAGVEVATNTAVARMERSGEHVLMGWAHAIFAAGAVLGPLLVAAALALGLPWQGAYRLMGGLFLLGILPLVLLSFQDVDRDESPAESADAGADGAEGGEGPARSEAGAGDSGSPPARPHRTSADRPVTAIVATAALTILVYVGVEIGVSNWSGEYLVSRFGVSSVLGSVPVFLFWTGLLAGRALMPVLFRNTALRYQLYALTVFLTLSLGLAALAWSPVVAALSFLLAGLGCSSIYPLVMTLAARRLTRRRSLGIGFISTGGGVGGFVFPFIVAFIAEALGIRAGFVVLAGLSLMLAAVSWLFTRYQ
jgi:fucose permease